MKPILVIGSLNMDLVIQADRAPQAGETLTAQTFNTIPGGKGANQAVAAARLAQDIPVHMAGCVGADAFGKQLVQNLAAEGIHTARLRQLDGISTGVALIIVESSGENRILIVPGANGQVTPADVDALAGLIQAAGMVVLQFEIPIPTVERAIQIANRNRVPVLLNPAPMRHFPARLLDGVDILVVNEVECSELTGSKVNDAASALAAGQSLLKGQTHLVVVTLGGKGAVVIAEGQSWHIPAFAVQAVDTTAAGDTFIGGLAASYLEGKDLRQCVRFAAAAAALAVTRIGAQSSIPHRQEVESFLTRH